MQAFPDPSDLQLGQLKAIALCNMSGELVIPLRGLMDTQLEYLETHSTTRFRRPTVRHGELCVHGVRPTMFNLPLVGEANGLKHPYRPFMLSMSQNEGMPATPANASSHAWYVEQCQRKQAAADCLEQAFGPQDRHMLAYGVNRVPQFIPIRAQDMKMEIVYCNEASRELTNQLMDTQPLEAIEADSGSGTKSGWVPRKVECTHTISRCNRCHASRHASG